MKEFTELFWLDKGQVCKKLLYWQELFKTKQNQRYLSDLFNEVVLRAKTSKGAAGCFLDTRRTAVPYQSARLFNLASCLRSRH